MLPRVGGISDQHIVLRHLLVLDVRIEVPVPINHLAVAQCLEVLNGAALAPVWVVDDQLLPALP